MPGEYAFSPSSVPVALTGVVILAFGTRVLGKRVTSVSAAFFTMTVVVAVWMATFTGMYSAVHASDALKWSRAAYFGVPFIAPALYWFTIEILRLERRRRLAHVAAWSIGAFFSAIAVTTDQLIPRVDRYWWGYYPRYDLVVGGAFLTFFFGYLVASLVEFLRAWPAAQSAERERIRLLVIAVGVAYLGVVDFFPKFGVSLYPFGYLPILGFIALVGLVVRRYDLTPLTPGLAAPEIRMPHAERPLSPNRIQNIVLDNDPVRPKGWPATDAEHAASVEVAYN